jgi:hypothetical protein
MFKNPQKCGIYEKFLGKNVKHGKKQKEAKNDLTGTRSRVTA